MPAPTLLSRNLVAYLASRFCAAAAMTMLRTGVAWHVFSLTSSPFHLGLIGIAQFVPAFSLMLVGGAVADVFDRSRIMMLAQLAALSAALVLFAGVTSGTPSLSLLYGV